MLRRLSSRMSGSGGERKRESKRKELEWKASSELAESSKQPERPKPPAELSTNQVRPIQPSTRIGTSLFQAKLSGVADSGQEMDRTLYEMPMPQNVDAMTDLIKLHEDGDKFPYVGIVGNEGETLDARRSRMLSLKPSLGLRNIPEIEVSGCPLIDTEGEFSMSALMEHAVTLGSIPVSSSGIMPVRTQSKNYAITKPYVHIKSVTGLYTPNMSSTADFCRLWFVLTDNRLINQGKCGQSNALVSNQEGVMEMSCDYCVSRADLGNFVLGYTLEREILKPGFQWGTVSFYFNITESDMPYQSSKRDALAVYRMPISTLTSRQTNADKSDISFTSRDIEQLRKMYLRGDIVDVDEPQKSRLKKSSYSKSTMRGVTKGEDIADTGAEGWSFMKGARKPMLDADVASVEVDSDGEEEEDIVVNQQKKEDWEKHQEALREMQKGEGKELVGGGSDKGESDGEPEIIKEMRARQGKAKLKSVGFKVEDV